jgi:hypothetical protein
LSTSGFAELLSLEDGFLAKFGLPKPGLILVAHLLLNIKNIYSKIMQNQG